ncbi:hypothetical protein HK100_001524 [Physocladia obscura]|uniref:Uncharacterized protein n=1 Tax=Physocladia obscura TaxID=109957 RepID=A0AAD5XG40_9FUNG|nr:hypothetical protein HK100_001524 [Physocladia obscura]
MEEFFSRQETTDKAALYAKTSQEAWYLYFSELASEKKRNQFERLFETKKGIFEALVRNSDASEYLSLHKQTYTTLADLAQGGAQTIGSNIEAEWDIFDVELGLNVKRPVTEQNNERFSKKNRGLADEDRDDLSPIFANSPTNPFGDDSISTITPTKIDGLAPAAEINDFHVEERGTQTSLRTQVHANGDVSGKIQPKRDSEGLEETVLSIIEGNPKALFDAVSKRIFEAKYQEMADSNKLKLKSGKYAEDIIPIHSFIFCPDDENSTAPFTGLEQEELKNLNRKEKPPMFSRNGMFLSFYKKFAKAESPHDLNSALFVAGHPELLKTEDPEFWICRIGEKCGLAGQERKDVTRKLPGLDSMTKRATGKKGDGYIRVFGNGKCDVGAMEAGPTWEGVGGTKSFTESGTVMPKVLRDILWSYVNRCRSSAEVLRKLVVPGILVYGEKFQRIELDSIGGYVTRVCSSGWKTLNLKGTVESFVDIFLNVFLVHTLVLQNETIASESSSDCNDDEDEDNFLVNLQEEIIAGKDVMGFDIGVSQPTPKKK